MSVQPFPSFRFREEELGLLRQLLLECALLVRPDQPSDLAQRLVAAGLVEPVAGIEPLVAYVLTPEGQAVIKHALG
jgi:hypothetical protein